MNFQTACSIIAKNYNYASWEALLGDNAAHTIYYQEAADLYADYQSLKRLKEKCSDAINLRPEKSILSSYLGKLIRVWKF